MVGSFLGLARGVADADPGLDLRLDSGLRLHQATGKDASTYELPFGTFLGAAALAAAIVGPKVVGWYGGL